MRRKDESVETKFHPELTAFLFEVDDYYRDKPYEGLENDGAFVMITSGSEQSARHGKSSLHYATPCCAADIRTWVRWQHLAGTELSPKQQHRDIEYLRNEYCFNIKMPADWIEVILEADHIHIEYQPKRIAA